MIQYLLFDTSKLLNISDITKRIGSFFKLPIQLFYGVPYPELAYIIKPPETALMQESTCIKAVSGRVDIPVYNGQRL